MRALPSHFANTCTFGRRLAKSYCYYLSSYHILGGRAYPVRYYPIAVRLRTLAFGNMVAMIVDPVNIRATCASALPTHSRSSYLPSVERLFRGDPIVFTPFLKTWLCHLIEPSPIHSLVSKLPSERIGNTSIDR